MGVSESNILDIALEAARGKDYETLAEAAENICAAISFAPYLIKPLVEIARRLGGREGYAAQSADAFRQAALCAEAGSHEEQTIAAAFIHQVKKMASSEQLDALLRAERASRLGSLLERLVATNFIGTVNEQSLLTERICAFRNGAYNARPGGLLDKQCVVRFVRNVELLPTNSERFRCFNDAAVNSAPRSLLEQQAFLGALKYADALPKTSACVEAFRTIGLSHPGGLLEKQAVEGFIRHVRRYPQIQDRIFACRVAALDALAGTLLEREAVSCFVESVGMLPRDGDDRFVACMDATRYSLNGSLLQRRATAIFFSDTEALAEDKLVAVLKKAARCTIDSDLASRARAMLARLKPSSEVVPSAAQAIDFLQQLRAGQHRL